MYKRQLLGRAGCRKSLSPAALDLLSRHCWPGNVRELRNVLERARALSEGPEIRATDLRIDALDPGAGRAGEGSLLLAAVARHGGSVSAAARALGVPRTTLRDRIARAQRR